MQNSNNDYLLEIFLADLKSDTKFIRELAIYQLHQHIDVVKVMAELRAAAEKESDPYLKSMLESLLAASSQNEIPATETPDQVVNQDSIIKQWHKRKLSSLQELFRQISLLPAEQHDLAMRQLICEETELFRLIPMFSLSNALIKEPQTIAVLAEMLTAKDQLFVIRLIPFLAETGRDHLIKALPKLLKHQNFMIRAETIRFLFKISRKHALRLLEELIFANAASQKSASTFLLLFPFEDVQSIVLTLIDRGAMRDPFIKRLIQHLASNNPDMEFFKRLTAIKVLRGEEIEGIDDIRHEAAEALQVAGIISQSAKNFCVSSLSLVSNYIKERAGISIGEKLVEDEAIPLPEATPEAAPESTPTTVSESSHQKAPETETSSGPTPVSSTPQKEKPAASISRKSLPEARTAATAPPISTSIMSEAEKPSADELKLKQMLELDTLSNDDATFLRKLLLSGQTASFNDLILKTIGKFKPSDSQAIRWLEENLETLSANDAIVAMKLLSELNPSRLLPHLPVLSMSENSMTATQAIRHFKKYNLKGLIKQIDSWLQEDSERAWNAALNALLQLNIEISSEILLKVFKTTNRISLIKFFMPVFKISPDHMCLYELELLTAESRGNKHELMEELTGELKTMLGLASQTESEGASTSGLVSAGLHLKWEELKQSIDKIRYISKNQLAAESLISFFEKHIGKMLIVTTIMFIYCFWPDTSMPEPDAVPGSDVKNTFEIKAAVPELKAGEHKIFTLESYDPINRSWRAKGLDGKVYKLKLPIPGNFSPGFKGDFKVLYFSTTRLGYPIVTADLVSESK